MENAFDLQQWLTLPAWAGQWANETAAWLRGHGIEPWWLEAVGAVLLLAALLVRVREARIRRSGCHWSRPRPMPQADITRWTCTNCRTDGFSVDRAHKPLHCQRFERPAAP